jgi:hypothetical protein
MSNSSGGNSSGEGGAGRRPQGREVVEGEGVPRERPREGRPLTFEFNGQSVGYFEGIDAYPTTPGKFRYMPYRAIGHLKMIEACARDGSARCTYTGSSGPMACTVRTAGEYGLLDISEIAPAA